MSSSGGGWGGGGSSSGPFTFDFYGYREFVNMLIELLKFYSRHSLLIRPVLPTGVAAAMDALLAIPDLATWNEPGPA